MNLNLSVKQIRALRITLALSIVAAIALSTVFKGELATLCAVCPIGLAQLSVASGSLLPLLIYSVIGIVLLALLFGRGFCAWGCPVNLVPGKVSNRRGIKNTISNFIENKIGFSIVAKHEKSEEIVSVTQLQKQSMGNLYRSIALIAAILLVSLFVGFPVFCLFCPIGLIFALLFAIFKVFTVYQANWDLLIIPLMLFVEFKLLRSWCLSFCPMGAIMSLVAKVSPIRLHQQVDKDACQLEGGCRVCNHVCPEHISAFTIGRETHDEQCTLCMECSQHCPHRALQKLSFIKNKNDKIKQVQ